MKDRFETQKDGQSCLFKKKINIYRSTEYIAREGIKQIF